MATKKQMEKQIDMDAAAFGAHVKRGEEWHFALLAARNTRKGTAGRPPLIVSDDTITLPTIREWAEKADVPFKTVARYRNAWDEYAPQYGLPTADELMPCDDVDLSKLPDWPVVLHRLLDVLASRATIADSATRAGLYRR